jgi:hypothetical protein
MKKFYKTLKLPDENGRTVVFSFHQTVPSAINGTSVFYDGKKVFSSEEVLALGGLPNDLNWGTKWDATYPEALKRDPVRFIVTFRTAWSPPILWLKKVYMMFPRLRFTIAFCESGSQTYGRYTYSHKDRETVTKEYEFLKSDIFYYRVKKDGTRVEDRDNFTDEEPRGRLKHFMKKHHLKYMGG